MKVTKTLFLLSFLLLISHSGIAQTPIANRVKAVIDHLPSDIGVVAKYTDNSRHSLFYTYNHRLYIYDVWNNNKHEVTFNAKGYEKILHTYLSPDGDFVFVVIDNGDLASFYLEDGQELWCIDSRTRRPSFVGKGYRIFKHKGHFIIKKAFKCLNPSAPQSHQKWMGQDHYYDFTGKMLWTKDEYIIKE